MTVIKRRSFRVVRLSVISLTLALVSGIGLWRGGQTVEANHPVLVEGNCDSPVPGTTLVSPGTCGDYDGDGRIGTAEDTDGADRIFGTIMAAMGPGTGAAAGTGANHNGLVRIVASGRFAEAIHIGHALGPVGSATPGNVTLEAAPGVNAIIDAVLQGDPAGNNNPRQAGSGIFVFYIPSNGERRVVLRNLTIRNFNIGIETNGASVEVVDCRLENNLNYGIRAGNNSRLVVLNTEVVSTGHRIGTSPVALEAAQGIRINAATAKLVNTTVSYSAGVGIWNNLPSASALTLYRVSSFFNTGGNIIGPSTICTDAALCQ